MENPTFSKKQTKTTLSAKKKKSSTVKHVLVKPYTKKPSQITPEDQKTLTSLLENLLPRIKEDRVRIPYGDIKSVPKEKRKEFRENFYKNRGLVIDKSQSKGLALGVNNVTKVLETDSASAVLISDDIKEKLIVDHVHDLAVLRKTPVLVVPNLRNILKEKCGVSATCMSLNKLIKPDTNLYWLQQNIVEIYQKYPRSENELNIISNDSCIIINDDDVPTEEQPIVIDHEAIRSRIYLRRSNPKERVFKPPASRDVGEAMEVNSREYFSLSLNDVNVRPKGKYMPLKVKVVKGDPNRNKRKIEQLKLRKSEKKKKKKKVK